MKLRLAANLDRSALLVGAIALIVQAVYLALAVQDPAFALPIIDEAAYHESAIRLANGGRLIDDAFWQPPLFPLLLGCLYWVTGPSVVAAKVALGAVAVASCVLVWSIGRQAFSRRVGIVAGIMAAFYGPYLFFSTQLLPTGLAVFLDLVAISFWLGCLDKPRWHGWIGFGLTAGLATITVPNSAVLVMLALLGQLIAGVRRREWRTAFAVVSLTMAGFGGVVGTVMVRNHSVSGNWVVLSTNGGINLFIGNNPQSEETVAVRPGESWRRLMRTGYETEVRSRSQQNVFFRNQVLRYAWEQPMAFLGGLARKAGQAVNAREIPRNVDPYIYRGESALLRAMMWRAGPFAFPFGIVAPLAAVGVVLSLRKRRQRTPKWSAQLALVGFVVTYAGSIVLFFVSSRYRVPMAVAMLPFAAAGAVAILDAIRSVSTSRRHLLAGGLVFTSAATLVHLPLPAPTDDVNFQAERALCLGSAYLGEEKLDEGERHFRRALALTPRYADAAVGLSGILVRRGRLDEAEALLQESIAWDRRSAESRVRLGHLLRVQDRHEEAIDVYLAAVSVDPTSPEARFGLADALADVGRTEEAIEHYRRAVEFSEDRGPVLIGLAAALVELALYEEAIERYRQGLFLVEPSPETLNQVAWLLATCPQVELRDCERAIEIAEDLNRMTEFRHAVAMDTLAASYAECRRWSDAVTWSRRAISQAMAEDTPSMAEAFRRRLAIYEKRWSKQRLPVPDVGRSSVRPRP